MKKFSKVLIVFTLLSWPFSLLAQWQPKITPIKTPWTDQVDKNSPLQEYPRPQLVRKNWLNMNGHWQFKVGSVGDAVPHNQTLGRDIIVPFAVESTISGITEHHERVWYRKTFTVPSQWNGQRIIMHFGAIDWESEIYINGNSLGIHKGGYDEITHDITDYISASGEQEVIVRVYDPTRDYGQPRGKQTTAPGGIMYTAVTGIWQTVWLEPVADQHITGLKMTPDIDNNTLTLSVNSNSTGLTADITVKEGNSIVTTYTGTVNSEITLPIPNPKLWSPESPFLYDLEVKLISGSAVVDEVSSYFGMRKIAIVKNSDTPVVYLNNEQIFMFGPLDQGFWPDGIYTAPTDDALKFDIESTKALGFNFTRKHIKVEPQRWYYWADKLGLMVWQDMPSANSYDTPEGVEVQREQFDLELTRMIETHYNSPSIISWVIFNEWQGSFDPDQRVSIVRSLDPTRIINQGSGGPFSEAGDIRDEHSYPPPSSPSSDHLAVVCGEYGGIGLRSPDHMWGNPGNPYGEVVNDDELVEVYSNYVDMLEGFKSLNDLSGAVYTEITDVENEINGFLTYDRRWKVDPARIKAVNQRLIKAPKLEKAALVPTSKATPQTWKYTTNPPSADWNSSNFNDAAWASGQGGFGKINNPNANVNTNWESADIWLRKSFDGSVLSKGDLKYAEVSVFYDDDVEVYINGVLAFERESWNTNYHAFPISNEAKNAINLTGSNVIAVHCHQNEYEQFIDVGLLSAKTDLSLASNKVIAYKDCNYTGKGVIIEVGDYNLDRLYSLGIANDDISSIKLPEGYKVMLYNDNNFQGESIEISASNSCLVEELFGDNQTNWNDKTSSLRIIAPGVTGLGGVYNLENRRSSLVMDVAENGNPANGTNILQYYPTGNPNQQFRLTEVSPGVYSIICVATGKSADVDDFSQDNFANLLQWEYLNGSNQHFKIEATTDGYYKLRATHSNKIIEVAYASTEAEANIGQYDDNNQRCGQWKLIPIQPLAWSKHIEAETYSNMSGIQNENCSEGGQNVAYTDTGDWMVYSNITIPETGQYTLEFRVASASTGSVISVDLNAGSTVLGSINVPNTGDWQNWTTISKTFSINAGTYDLGTFAETGGWNLNWINIKKADNSFTRISEETAAHKEVILFPNPAEQMLHIKGADNDSQYVIYNTIGEIIKRDKLQDNNIDISQLKSGVYILQLKTQKNSSSLRFNKL